jgi:hypothetical protein
MSKILEGMGSWFRNAFGPSQEAKLRERRQSRESERKALADKREQANRTAAGLEDVIRQKLAVSQSMSGTALTVITDDMNRLARELRNVRDALIDNNNRLAAAEEEIHKIDLLLQGANDMTRATELERLAIELEVQRDSSTAVRDAFQTVVATSPVTSHTQAAGLNDGLAEFRTPTARPALDPIIMELGARSTPPPPPAASRREAEPER